MMNSYQHPTFSGLIFAFIEGLLIIKGIFIGILLRFGWNWEIAFRENEFFIWKVLLIIFVMQISYYYFDLYEFRLFKEKTKTAVLLLESLGVSTIFLAVFYYVIPDLALGRGVFVISLFAIFILSLLWRIIYPWIFGKSIFKEKVLIIGTGELAQKIHKEIMYRGQDLYEIVGFIDENGRKPEERIYAGDTWRIQSDFFHLQAKSDR